MTTHRLTIVNQTKGKPPGLPFASMKNAILGKNYTLSLIFIDPKKSQELNRTYRAKNEPTDILSFPIHKKEGEIYIDIPTSTRKAKEFGRPFENFIGFLFIHGCVHLEGLTHGSTMENIEARFRKEFGI